MHATAKIAMLAVIGASAIASPALAGTANTYRTQDTLNYHVVDIGGGDHLNLRSRPTTAARIVAEIPFDQRGLATTGDEKNGWIELRFWDEDGRAITGWASARFLEEDIDGEPTTYAVTGVDRYDGLEIRREEGAGRLVGTLRYDATGVEGRGACSEFSCPIRFSDRSGSLRGWVARENLKVERVVDRPVEDENAYQDENASTSYWEDLRQRRAERRERWHAFWQRFWSGRRHASY